MSLNDGTHSAQPAGLVSGRERSQLRRRGEAERRILGAAEVIVAEQGLHALTLSDAGIRAGYSRGLPTHHFRTKDEFLSAVVSRIIEAHIADPDVDDTLPDGVERLFVSIRIYLDRPRHNPVTVRAFQAVLANAPAMPWIAVAVTRATRAIVARLAKSIEAGIGSGRIHSHVDAEAQAMLILAALRGAIEQWLIDPEATDLDRISALLVATLERSLLK